MPNIYTIIFLVFSILFSLEVVNGSTSIIDENTDLVLSGKSGASAKSKPVELAMLTDLLKYDGKGTVLVKENLKGGLFHYSLTGSASQVDSGMVYFWKQAQKVTNEGYWSREIPASGKVSVSFWCKNDGISDETYALRSALTYATTTGRTLLFNSGIYHVSGNITDLNSIKSSCLSMEFGKQVKISVTGTGKFSNPMNRILIFYGTSDIPHRFSMTGGHVEIDGGNFIQCAISTGQAIKLNKSLIIDCSSLKIGNCFSGPKDVKNSNGLYTYGSYENMVIRNVTIENIDRDPAVNSLASQAMLIAHQGGKTLIENCDIENVGNSALTQDCDALVVRGDNPNVGEYVHGDVTIAKCTFKNSRGRHIKAQTSNVKVINCDFWQTTIRFFTSGKSIDFQFGNGVATGNKFHYPLVQGVSAFEGSAVPIAFQNRQSGGKMVCICKDNIVYAQSPFYSFLSFTANGNPKAGSAELECEHNQILPWDATVNNILTRNLVEMRIDNLESMPDSSNWSLFIRDNVLMTDSQLLSYTGYNGKDMSKKIKLEITGNKNTVMGSYLFSSMSGKQITSLKDYLVSNNRGWSSNFAPGFVENSASGK